MMEPTSREPEDIRQDCARKLRSVQVSDHFQAILGCLLGEDWTTPRLVEMVITADSHLQCDLEHRAYFLRGRAGRSAVVTRSGCQWNKIPERYGSDSTAHRWFQRFCQDGIFERLWGLLVETSEDLAGDYWDWQSGDGRLGKARYGGKKVGKNPTDRGKPGTKTSLLVDEQGEPLGVAIDAAKVPDGKLPEAITEAIVVARPEPTAESPQHLCLEKGYDNPKGQQAADAGVLTPHIRRIGEEKKVCDRLASTTMPAL